MHSEYAAIQQTTLKKPTPIVQPRPDYMTEITEESPAAKVMTNLNHVTPATTRANTPLKTANRQMIERAVRMLFVVDEEQHLKGIITSIDILGEKPIKHMQRVNCKRDDIDVKDVMTPIEQIQVLDLSDVEYAKTGNILTTLKRSGRHHILVAERQADGTQSICGIFSLSHISRLMNKQVEVIEIANTFAEVESALHH